MERGAFLVLEGCDRVGKSTQVRRLVNALNNLGIKAESKRFPDRTTTIGKVIDDFLTHKNDLSRETMLLLYSANRWECKKRLIKTLESGTTLIVDRYAASGAAYGAVSTERDLSWCKESDRGLPAPDLVAFITMDEETQSSRGGWADERFENQKFQQQVRKHFSTLMDDTWKVIEGDQDEDRIHEELLKITLELIDKTKNQPIKNLYEE